MRRSPRHASRRSPRPRPGPLEPPIRLRVRRPADFLAVLPYTLGFHPRESVVAAFFRAGRLVVTARMDLPPPSAVVPLLDGIGAMVAEHGIDDLVLVVYGADQEQGREVLVNLLAGAELVTAVREALLVSGERWWSLTCDGSCCPEGGTPLDTTTHPLAAAAVYAGLSAQPDRETLAAAVAGPAAENLPRLTATVAAARARVAVLDRHAAADQMARTVDRWLDDPDGPDEEASALLAVLALDLAVRDVAWAMMSREDGEQHVRLWSRVVATAPDEVAAGPLGLLGMAAWICGHGALQNCCAERLGLLAPGYTLVALLTDLADRAVPPSLWDAMGKEVRREVAAVAGLRGLH